MTGSLKSITKEEKFELLKEISKFELLLSDILGSGISRQQAQILALMFKLGGYTRLNDLTNLMSLAQPTVSLRVAELVEMGYLRKNSELLPVILVLLLKIDTLKAKLYNMIESQRNAAKFLKEMAEIKYKQLGKDTFIRAIQVLYAKEKILAHMLSNVYLNNTVSIDELYNHFEMGKEDHKKTRRAFNSILSSRNDVFHVFYPKRLKKEMYVQPKLPLGWLVSSRMVYLESLFSYYHQLIGELSNFITMKYESIIPHQLLRYPSEIKLRIDACLKNYSKIKIIDNSIYRKSSTSRGILGLILDNEHFSRDHQMKVLIRNGNQLPEIPYASQIEAHTFSGQVSKDYLNRDFIIFGNHGCLVFPLSPDGIPYYNISPGFIKTILDIFNSNWRKETDAS